MTRRGRRSNRQVGTATKSGNNGGDTQGTDRVGGDNRQLKDTTSQPTTLTGSPGAPRTRANALNAPQATPTTAGDKPIADTKTESPRPGGPRKPRWRDRGPRRLLSFQDHRLWDPSKGTKMASNQSPSQTQRGNLAGVCDTPARASKSKEATGKDTEKQSTTSLITSHGAAIPNSTTGHFRNFTSNQPLDTTYVVPETCDPDSFDRGGAVRRIKMSSSHFNHQQRERSVHNLKREEQDKHDQERNRSRAENHWGNIGGVEGHWGNINDSDAQETFQDTIYQMQKNQPAAGEEEVYFEQPIRPPSHALQAFLSNTDDKLLGRFIYQPSTASGCSGRRHHDSRPAISGSRLVSQTASLTLHDHPTTGDATHGLLVQLPPETETEKLLDGFFKSLTRARAQANITAGENISLAGLGARFHRNLQINIKD